MNPSTTINLPFGLQPEQMAGVKIFYAFYSGKVGAGKQELTLSGDGSVHLMKTLTYNSPEEKLEGKLPRMNFVRLLEIVEEVNFPGLEEDYPPAEGHPYWRRVLRLELPGGRTHTVIVQNDRVVPEFERLVGAVRAMASVAVPQVLGRQFFPNL
jgi:hypothetical protein